MNNNTEFNNFNSNNGYTQNPDTNQNINSNSNIDMNSYGMAKSGFNKNKIFKLLIIIVVVILAIIVIKSLSSNDNKSVSVNKNQTLVECGIGVINEGEKTKTTLVSYVLENDKIVKYISSEIYYLNVSSNITEEDINKFKSEAEAECDLYPDGECEVSIDYKKNELFRYDIILTNSLLDELNNSIVGLTEEEIIEKIKVKEEKNLLSCEVK